MQQRSRNHTSKKNVKRGISYGRVSTFDQAFNRDGSRKEDASPEAQRSRCSDHIIFLNSKKGTNYQILDHISDDGFSGKNTNRPGYQQLWDLITSNTIDFVVTTELSRISRSVLDFLELVSHCEAHQVDLVIIGLDLDTSAPIGRVMVIILVALAQFEREMTSQRVRENALNRLLKDGKINGAAEILGLDRDPENPGHFLVNHEELIKAEKILSLFLRFSSKNKVLKEARALGLTGKRGRELTAHMIDTVIDNAKWRYRGLWYANKENEHKDPEFLPETKRFQIVDLPHGLLIEESFLDKVEEKLKNTYEKKKRCGKDGRIYMLSHVLEFEDGSTYYGGPAKDRQYFYYYCKGKGPNIRCEEIESVVIDRIKCYFRGNKLFQRLVENAVKKRIQELPKLDSQIGHVQKELSVLEEENNDLRSQLRDKAKRSGMGFMRWLEGEVEKIQKSKEEKERELALLLHARSELIRKSGLERLESTAQEFIARFDSLTGVQKRDYIERMIAKVVIKKDNKIEIHVLWEPQRVKSPVMTRKVIHNSMRKQREEGIAEKLIPEAEEINGINCYSDFDLDKKNAVTETTLSSISKRDGGPDVTRTLGLKPL